jgi:hypothetical protein
MKYGKGHLNEFEGTAAGLSFVSDWIKKSMPLIRSDFRERFISAFCHYGTMLFRSADDMLCRI